MPVAHDDDAVTALALLAKLTVSEKVDDEASYGLNGMTHDIGNDLDELDRKLDSLADDIATLMTRVYEIQEIRHTPATTLKLDDRLQALDSTLEILSHRLTKTSEEIQGVDQGDAEERDFKARLEAVEQAWKEAVEEDAVLREELREDRWLVVFRTAAEQADNMVDSLQKAINQCSDFISAVESGTSSQDYDLATFDAIDKNYNAKKKFYVPSVSKSLSILDKGIKERITKNGETLRRHADMKRRWTETTLKLAQLDVQLPRVRMKLQGLHDDVPASMGTQELLTSPGSSTASLLDESWASPQSTVRAVQTPGRPGIFGRVTSSLSPNASPQPMRRRPSSSAISALSSVSGTNSARPPWNASPRPVDDIGPANSSTVKAAVKLNQNKRLNSLYSLFGSNRRASSPGASSSTSTVDSSRPPSRIPLPSPRRVVSSPAPPPRLSLSSAPPVPQIPAGLQSPSAQSAKSFDRASAAYLRSSMMTPEPVLRQRATQMPFYTSSRTSTMSNAMSTPTRQSRQSLGSGSRAPPSAYRATTPTPSRSGAVTPSRAGAATPSRAGAATPSMDRPRAFVPNPIDELDLEIAKLLAAHPGELLVQRTDPPLRANQLRSGHEWKGEYIFGGGKVMQCRLLELAKVGKQAGRSRKVMVRVGGVWMELSTYLAKL